jgi:hypothetical protein
MTMNFQVNFKTLDGRRLSQGAKQININNNSTINAVSKSGDKMSVSFVFSSTYEPNVGVIRLEGELLVEAKKEDLDYALAEWDKSEKTNLPKEVAEKVHNAILSNCIVEASMLARDLKLPAPIPLPQVSMNKPEDKTDDTDTSYIR